MVLMIITASPHQKWTYSLKIDAPASTVLMSTYYTSQREAKMVYSQIKELHETTNKAATDLHEMKRQYAMAIRGGNNDSIVKLAHSVGQLESAYALLCEIVDDLK